MVAGVRAKSMLMTLALSAVMAAVVRADANCARPVTYEVHVEGNAVRIEALSFDRRGCPDPGGMLRQDTTTGEVVRLADFCASDPSGRGAAYLDECVAPGTFRYGFATPYECIPSACSTDYFVE